MVQRHRKRVDLSVLADTSRLGVKDSESPSFVGDRRTFDPLFQPEHPYGALAADEHFAVDDCGRDELVSGAEAIGTVRRLLRVVELDR